VQGTARSACEAGIAGPIPVQKSLTSAVSLSSQAEQQEDSNTRPSHDADEVEKLLPEARTTTMPNTVIGQ
jgi:hypothetical protein